MTKNCQKSVKKSLKVSNNKNFNNSVVEGSVICFTIRHLVELLPERRGRREKLKTAVLILSAGLDI